MTKSLDENFIDWESSAFGFGYGTGEPHILAAIKTFFAAIGRDDSPRAYDYEKLEAAVGATVAWLLINRLAHHSQSVIEYGTSPRYGWLTTNGEALKEYIDAKSADELTDLVCRTTEDTNICYPDACNCGPSGYEKGRVCFNPFWPRRT